MGSEYIKYNKAYYSRLEGIDNALGELVPGEYVHSVLVDVHPFRPANPPWWRG